MFGEVQSVKVEAGEKTKMATQLPFWVEEKYCLFVAIKHNTNKSYNNGISNCSVVSSWITRTRESLGADWFTLHCCGSAST